MLNTSSAAPTGPDPSGYVWLAVPVSLADSQEMPMALAVLVLIFVPVPKYNSPNAFDVKLGIFDAIFQLIIRIRLPDVGVTNVALVDELEVFPIFPVVTEAAGIAVVTVHRPRP